MISLPVWQTGLMLLLRWVSVSGPMFLPGGPCPGGSLSRVSVRETPPRQRSPTSDERAVCIPLEYFLVYPIDLHACIYFA